MDILKRIEEQRLKRNWTIWRLSEESGVDQSTISAWDKKGRIPSITSLQKICDAFDMTMSQFFADEDSQITLTKQQAILLDRYAALSPQLKKSLIDLIDCIIAKID